MNKKTPCTFHFVFSIASRFGFCFGFGIGFCIGFGLYFAISDTEECSRFFYCSSSVSFLIHSIFFSEKLMCRIKCFAPLWLLTFLLLLTIYRPFCYPPFSVAASSSSAVLICVCLELNQAVCSKTADKQSLAVLECAADVDELIWSPKTECLFAKVRSQKITSICRQSDQTFVHF